MTYSSQPPTMPTPLHRGGAARCGSKPRPGTRKSMITQRIMHLARACRPARHASASVLFCAFVLTGVVNFGVAAQAAPKSFTLVSPTIRNGATMPITDVGARANCKGSNQSPPLAWLHPPDGTASYAVSMADLDAKVGVVWLWLMFNIPASLTALPQNAAADPQLRPAGAAQARNGFNTVGYLGPCPRKDSIAHHYLITVWAVNQPNLPFKDGTAAQAVAIYLRSHAVGHASLTPHYGGH